MRCLVCGVEFEGRGRAKFCSIRCKSSYHRIVSSDGSIVSPIVSGGVIVSDDDIGVPAGVVDLEKDLNLDMEKDLGIMSWTADGIFLRPDITVSQVQNIAKLIHAKHNRSCPEFRECR